MDKRTYKIISLVVVIILGMVVGATVNSGNWLVPVAGMLIAMGLLYLAKKRVHGVIADERDYKIASQASRSAYFVFTLIMCVTGLILYSLGRTSRPEFFVPGSVILYSLCLLVVLQSAFFMWYNRKGE
ncbi:MAG: DUF2178 domain-containing protein [Patescibacteria group bacterium]|nr:DUF2178 domain-containing protein [Patescibacteria group bacterium]